VAEISASTEIGESPESIWRVLMALEAWPEWSPLFQLVEMHDPSSGITAGFKANGLVGRIPYTARFTVPILEPLQRVVFEAERVSPPYSVLWHDVRLAGSTLTWTIVYTISGGPGGILVDRLMIRRRASDLIEQQLAVLAERVSYGQT
jgi:uncharacterized protein YndB with AHSA1/START domain